MPNFDATLTNFSVGDDIDVIRTITNVPVGQTIISGLFVTKLFDGACPALFTQSATISGTTITFSIPKDKTRMLPSESNIPYWIYIVTSENKRYTPEKGFIFAFPNADCL